MSLAPRRVTEKHLSIDVKKTYIDPLFISWYIEDSAKWRHFADNIFKYIHLQ